MSRMVFAAMSVASAQLMRSQRSSPRFVVSIFGRPSASRGNPASTHALKPARIVGALTRRSP